MNGTRAMPGGNASFPIEAVAKTAKSPDARTTLILRELQTMLKRLIETGETSRIDLRRTSLAPQDLETLRTVLGRGEVRATVDSLGATRIRDTGVAGIWWLTHDNLDGRTVVELVEVTECPELLKTRRVDLPAGLERLGAELG